MATETVVITVVKTSVISPPVAVAVVVGVAAVWGLCLVSDWFTKSKPPSTKENKSEQRGTIEDNEKKLLNQMAKTSDPKVIANIIRRGVPMDLTCVAASWKLLPQILRQSGMEVPRLTIIVLGENGMLQEFPCPSDGAAEEHVIFVELRDNHFTLSGSSLSDGNHGCESKNNCLYEALSEAFPQLSDQMTGEQFRAAVANCIESDKEIGEHIQKGYHQYPMSLGLFGGREAPKSTKRKPDEESSTQNEYPEFSDEEYHKRVKLASKHYKRRFRILFRAAGLAQRASRLFNVPKNRVFLKGSSQFKDQCSGKGKKFHAAHVLRCRINFIQLELSVLQSDAERAVFDELINRVGHTQVVPRFANLQVGRPIDEIQVQLINKVLSIDWSEEPTEERRKNFQDIKNEFIHILYKCLPKCRTEVEKAGIIDAIEILGQFTYEEARQLVNNANENW